MVGGLAPALGAPAPTDMGTLDETGVAAPTMPKVPASARAFTHGGATGTRLWVDPDRDLVFVFLTNLWGASDAAMFETLAGVYAVLDQG